MKNIITLTISLLILTSCGHKGYIALQDAEKGMFLDRASTTSVSTFFDRRLENELESQLSKDWHIVNEDSEYIYYGQVMKKNGFTMINPFYKVKKEVLIEKFPGFRSIEGRHIKAKVFQNFIKPVIKEQLINVCPQSFNVQYAKRQYTLTDQGIKSDISFTGRCYENKILKANLHVLLNPENLEVINADTDLK